jgi:hypothetical protein
MENPRTTVPPGVRLPGNSISTVTAECGSRSCFPTWPDTLMICVCSMGCTATNRLTRRPSSKCTPATFNRCDHRWALGRCTVLAVKARICRASSPSILLRQPVVLRTMAARFCQPRFKGQSSRSKTVHNATVASINSVAAKPIPTALTTR